MKKYEMRTHTVDEIIMRNNIMDVRHTYFEINSVYLDKNRVHKKPLFYFKSSILNGSCFSP